MEMRRLVLLLALLLNASCSTSAEDDWSWDVEVDGSTNSDLGFPDSSASVDVDANSPGVDGETVSLPESWPKVDEAGGGKSLLDLVMHAWGGVAAAPIEGELETTLAGDDWEQREGRLNWTEAQAIYGFAWGALQQFEGDAKCALEVDGEKLTVVNAPGPDESPGSSLSGTFQGSDLEANFSDFMATDAVTVEGAEFMALCAAAEGQPVALAQVYTLADSGAQMALSTGGLEALAKEVQSAAVLLAERRTLLCCEEGFYLTGYTGVLGAIADLEGVAATATCIWAEPAVPQSCGGACTAAADCREAQCSDGQDNDSDGATDCADEDCESAVCDGDGSICDEGECQTCESSGPEICDNGSDEDCDGKVDCADSDCDGESCGAGDLLCLDGDCKCPSDTEDCADEIDNDCDGDIDCDDADCDGKLCGGDGELCVWELLSSKCECPGSGPESVCGNGEDDDCDGDVDCDDADCLGLSCGASGEICKLNVAQVVVCECASGSAEGICNDGQDNDCDGEVDCDDSDCLSEPCGPDGQTCLVDLETLDASCACAGGDTELECMDGKDNDCDGSADCEDPDCDEQVCGADGVECDAIKGECLCPWGDEILEKVCNDGVDNNCNGLADCDDAMCIGELCGDNGKVCDIFDGCVCPGGKTEAACDDGQDNDCDGKVDCADADCEGMSCEGDNICLDGECTCLVSEATETSCADGKDNDCDGQVDCADTDCPEVNCCLKGGLECVSFGCEKECLDAGGIVGGAGACWEQVTCPCVDDEYEPNETFDDAVFFPMNGDSGSISAVYCPGTNFLNQDYFSADFDLGDAFEATITVVDGTKPFDIPLQWAPPSHPNGLTLVPQSTGDKSWTVASDPLGTNYLGGMTSGDVALMVQASTRFSYTLDWTISRCVWDELEINNTLNTAASIEQGKGYDLSLCQDDVDYLGIGTILPTQKLTVTIQYIPGDYNPFFGWNIWLYEGTDVSAVSGTYGSPKQDPGGTVTWSYFTGPSETRTDARIAISGNQYFKQNPTYTITYQIEDSP